MHRFSATAISFWLFFKRNEHHNTMHSHFQILFFFSCVFFILFFPFQIILTFIKHFKGYLTPSTGETTFDPPLSTTMLRSCEQHARWLSKGSWGYNKSKWVRYQELEPEGQNEDHTAAFIFVYNKKTRENRTVLV